MKRRFLTCILWALTALAAAAQSVSANLVDAVSLYGNGQYKRAGQLLQTLSAAAPQDDAVWYYLGLTQIRLQDLPSAETSLEKAVALDGGNYWYRHALARLYLMRGRKEEALSQYETLVRDFPDKSTPVYELLDAYLDQKQYEKAVEVLKELESRHGPSEEMVRTLHDVYMAMGKQDEALAVLDGFNKQFSSPQVLSMIGDHYLADFSDSLAQRHYLEALELNSGYMPAVLGLSETYRHQRRFDDYFRTLQPLFASEEVPAASKSMYLENMGRSIDPKTLQRQREGFDSLVETATAAHPSDSTLLLSAGRYYYSTGRLPQAGKYFCQAADAHPESLQLQALAVQALSLQEDWTGMRDRSLEVFKRSRELAFLEYANLANLRLKDYDAVIGNSQYVITHFGKQKDVCVSAWSVMGDAYHMKGDNRMAFKCYEKVLKLDPSYAPALNNYAYYLSLEGKSLKKAYNLSRKTVEAEPDNATYLDTFAWILHLMGRDLEAKPFFKHAMLYGGKESAVILDHYAEVLYALGEYDMARLYWNQATSKNTEGEIPDLEERIKTRLDAIK